MAAFALMPVGFLEGLIDLLTGSDWTYLLLLGICAGDAVIPLLPSESALIVCGVQAARGELTLGWVIFFGALGALIGDNTSYALGRFVGKPITDRLFNGERARSRLDWARKFLKERGSYVLVIARFIPGGRTATTFTSGLVHLRWLTQFFPYVVVAAIFWASFGALIGYLGGKTFEDQPMLALLLAFGIAATIGGLAELVRRWRLS
jgi:membrane-associated protein